MNYHHAGRFNNKQTTLPRKEQRALNNKGRLHTFLLSPQKAKKDVDAIKNALKYKKKLSQGSLFRVEITHSNGENTKTYFKIHRLRKHEKTHNLTTRLYPVVGDNCLVTTRNVIGLFEEFKKSPYISFAAFLKSKNLKP